MRADTSFEQLQEALKPLWKYAGARSLADGAASAYEEEPGIKFDAQEHMLQMCWTVRGDDDFRQSLDEMCMSLNELAELGVANRSFTASLMDLNASISIMIRAQIFRAPPLSKKVFTRC